MGEPRVTARVLVDNEEPDGEPIPNVSGHPHLWVGSTKRPLKAGSCNVSCYNDDFFVKIRKKHDVQCDFLAEAYCNLDFKPGGGKGGALMAYTKDRHFIVKELVEQDHQMLLRLAEDYLKHLDTGPSLLSPFYLHFVDKSTGKKFVAMRNMLPTTTAELMYDLKGCADDKTLVEGSEKVAAVHKRIWNVHMWLGQTCWSDERKRYFCGKQAARGISIDSSRSQKEQIVKTIERDCEWLKKHRLMDYSLLVAIQRTPVGASDKLSPEVDARNVISCRNGGEVIHTYLAIIDFLQEWTLAKRVAGRLKALERDKATIPPEAYSRRFLRHFTSALTGEAEEFHAVETPRDAHDLQASLSQCGLDVVWSQAELEAIGALHDITAADEGVMPVPATQQLPSKAKPCNKEILRESDSLRHRTVPQSCYCCIRSQPSLQSRGSGSAGFPLSELSDEEGDAAWPRVL